MINDSLGALPDYATASPKVLYDMLQTLLAAWIQDAVKSLDEAPARFPEEPPESLGEGMYLAMMSVLGEEIAENLVQLGAFGDGPEIDISGEIEYRIHARKPAASPGPMAAWFRDARAAGLFRPQF